MKVHALSVVLAAATLACATAPIANPPPRATRGEGSQLELDPPRPAPRFAVCVEAPVEPPPCGN